MYKAGTLDNGVSAFWIEYREKHLTVFIPYTILRLRAKLPFNADLLNIDFISVLLYIII